MGSGASVREGGLGRGNRLREAAVAARAGRRGDSGGGWVAASGQTGRAVRAEAEASGGDLSLSAAEQGEDAVRCVFSARLSQCQWCDRGVVPSLRQGSAGAGGD